MQSITVLFLQNTAEITAAIPCSGGDRNICSKIESAYDSGAYSFSLSEFQDIPALHPEVNPVVNAWNINRFPAIAFLNNDDQEVFYAINGNKISTSRIKAVFDAVEEFTYNENTGGFIGSDGQAVDFSEQVDKKSGGVLGAKFGVSWGLNWGKCNDYLPDVVCKAGSLFFIALIILLIGLIAYKIWK